MAFFSWANSFSSFLTFFAPAFFPFLSPFFIPAFFPFLSPFFIPAFFAFATLRLIFFFSSAIFFIAALCSLLPFLYFDIFFFKASMAFYSWANSFSSFLSFFAPAFFPFLSPFFIPAFFACFTLEAIFFFSAAIFFIAVFAARSFAPLLYLDIFFFKPAMAFSSFASSFSSFLSFFAAFWVPFLTPAFIPFFLAAATLDATFFLRTASFFIAAL